MEVHGVDVVLVLLCENVTPPSCVDFGEGKQRTEAENWGAFSRRASDLCNFGSTP